MLRARERQRRSANTQITPPCGTIVSVPRARSMRAVMPCASTPQPDCTAMYCTPSTSNEVGTPVMPEFVRYCHSSSPVAASNAWKYRSFVPPREHEPAGRRHDGPPVRRLILVRPHSLARAQVPGLQLADVVGALGDDEIDGLRARVLLAGPVLDFFADEVLAEVLVGRNVEIARAGVVRGRRPVLTAPQRRAVDRRLADCRACAIGRTRAGP